MGLVRGQWTQIVAPLADLVDSSLVDRAVDWKRVQKIQITAHGSGPYDGKYIMLDDVVGVASSERATRMKRVAQLRVELAALQIPTMAMMDDESPSQTHIMVRGDYHHPGIRSTWVYWRACIRCIPELPRNRLGLAKWLVSDANPLTPRVVVNRIWSEVFGRGIVSTPEDFGMQGGGSESPSTARLASGSIRRPGLVR